MTKEERDRREAGKRARLEGSPDIGGVTLPFSRATLLRAFWAFMLLYPSYMLWTAKSDLTFEGILSGSILFVACMLPGWFWCTGRIQGLPIFPIFTLNFLPSYVAPLWQGHELLQNYSKNEINNGAWTLAAFLLIAQLFWQQMAVRAVGVPQSVRMINLKKAEKVLIICLVTDVLFELIQVLLWQFGTGGFAAIRGFTSAAGRMGIFVFSYQLGQKALSPAMKYLFISLLALLIIQETASLLLANVLPTLGIAFAGYILGSGKIPWRALAVTVAFISVLHAGKYEMRERYFGKPRPQLHEVPGFMIEWGETGFKNLGLKSTKEEKVQTSTAAERAALVHLMIRIQTMTPSAVPYLNGASYEFIPPLLIPRIFTPNKLGPHTANVILAIHYGILQVENALATSVGFDPIMEAYANYGYLGVVVLAVVLGFFFGSITRLTIHVPMLSFGFLLGVQVIACAVSGWNTMGVFVTTIWQSFLALCGLSLFLMSKQNNPVWKYYALKLTEKLKLRPNAKLQKTLEEVNSVLQKEEQELVAGNGSLVAGPSSLQTSQTREELRRVEDEVAPVKHERPTRFVYGEKKSGD